MREQAQLLRGSLEIRSTIGVGTEVTARVPVPEAA
jgi:signal transduction histidine kinase